MVWMLKYKGESFTLLLFSRVWLFVTPGTAARLLGPSPSPGACSNSCPLSWWCHPTILSSVVPFSSCLQFSPGSGYFPPEVITVQEWGCLIHWELRTSSVSLDCEFFSPLISYRFTPPPSACSFFGEYDFLRSCKSNMNSLKHHLETAQQQ